MTLGQRQLAVAALTADCSRHTLLNECSKRSTPCTWTNQNGWLVYDLT